MQTKTYTLAKAGPILGDHYKEGDTVKLTPKQAERFVAEGRLKEAGKAPAKAKTEKPEVKA